MSAQKKLWINCTGRIVLRMVPFMFNSSVGLFPVHFIKYLQKRRLRYTVFVTKYCTIAFKKSKIFRDSSKQVDQNCETIYHYMSWIFQENLKILMILIFGFVTPCSEAIFKISMHPSITVGWHTVLETYTFVLQIKGS